MRRFFPIFVLPLTGCIWPFVSEVKHTPADPTRQAAPNRLDWATSDDPQGDFQRLIAPALGKEGKPAEFFPESHPLVKRFQYWLDVIDARMRERYPDRLAVVPKPLARVWASAGPNGFVVPIQQCVSTPVQFKGPVAGNAEALSIVGVNFSGLVFPAGDTLCLKNRGGEPELVEEWFGRNIGSCSLTVSGGQLVVGESCKRTAALEAAQTNKAKAFSVTGTSPVVTLSSALFALLESEQQLVGVIAHELGHYYRSHPAMWTKKYNFFYRLGATNEPVKPVPDASLNELGERAIAVSRKGELDDAAREVLRAATASHLGYYTFEQEADDIAAEGLVDLGIAPTVMIEKMFVFLKFKGIKDTEFEFGHDTCKRLYDANWMGSDGKPQYVPIGNFANPHHSLCYRAFNLDREIKAHDYKVSPTSVLIPNEPSWEVIRGLAKDISTPNPAQDLIPAGFVE
jgi:hypothetical protein